MGYKNENIKHRQGVASEPKHFCPNCGHPFKGLNKIPFMIACSKCKKVTKGEDL